MSTVAFSFENHLNAQNLLLTSEEKLDFFVKEVKLPFSDSFYYSDVYGKFLKNYPKVLELWKILPEQMHFEFFFDKFLKAPFVQDVSSNPSSNVSGKTIARFRVEVVSSLLRYLTFKTIHEKMVELYGRSKATYLSTSLLNGTFYLHDSASFICGYCLGVDFSRILTEGMPYGQLYSLPPKKPKTFINQVKEAVVELSNEFAGAIAFPTLILLYTYVYLKFYGANCTINEKEVKDDFQNLVHTVNKELRNGVESPFTNLSFFDRFILDEMITYVYPHFASEVGGKEWFLKKVYEVQKIVMEYLCAGDPVTGAPYRFPVLTANFLKDKRTGKVVDEEFLDLVCRCNTRGQMNIYAAEDARKYSMCCRFQPEYESLKFDSFGNGGINVGSIKVVTINLHRIALEVLLSGKKKVEELFFKKLVQRMGEAKKILDAYRECLRDFINKGMYRFFNMKWFDLDRHFFSTVGFIGFYEAVKTLGRSLVSSFSEKVLQTMDSVIKEFNSNSKGQPFKYNLEQIPGESAAVFLPKLDKYFFGEDAVPYYIYANQFVPLYVKHSLIDKIEIEGRFFKYLSGGGITHVNILHEMKPEEVKFLINFCVRKGVEHFALNILYSICENKHYSLGKSEVCPVCGARINDHLTRVVGFFVPVSSWVKERREKEFKERVFFTLAGRF